MVAGEASGDLLGSLLLRGMRQRWPDLAAAGIGGPRMAAEGFDCWWPHEQLSFFGYAEVLARLPELLQLRRDLRSRLLRDAPAAFVGIDAPDFNLGVEERLRERGIRTIHFVCPSIWAWRAQRVHRLARAADHVLCLFPFEPEVLARHGIDASFVGHPLADAIPAVPPRAAARAALGLPADATVVALLPGSRSSEIDQIAPLFVDAAARLRQQRPALRFVLPAVPAMRARIDAAIAARPAGVPLQVIDGGSHAVLAACDVALVASGTATLEAALFKRPMVIVYRVARLNWWRLRKLALQPWFGLPNILARRFVVPELIQDAATPEAIARETLAWLDDAPRRAEVERDFAVIHDQLRQDTAKRATDAIAQVIRSR